VKVHGLLTAAALLLAAPVRAQPAPQAPTHACPGVMIFFDSASARLTAPALSMLDSSWPRYGAMVREGGWLNVYAGADEVGPSASNLQLSRRRAEAVRRYYLRRGVPAGRGRVEAEGEAYPFATPDAHTPIDSVRAQNRYARISPEMPLAMFRRFYPGNLTC
jgi:outer membrane protein OmpA-like peptidoglycan-associated protein